MKTILITGGAGFIGFHLARHLLDDGNFRVVLVDNLNEYYDSQLKRDRLDELGAHENLIFEQLDISVSSSLDDLFSRYHFAYIVNLAAQAGVRLSKSNPDIYFDTNIRGFYLLMKKAVDNGVEKFLYASSSSVYGASDDMPYLENSHTGTPMSFYAATKVANEAIASSFFYSHGVQTIGFRLFNVYGPWGRPDMAYYKWADALCHDGEIELRDKGEMWRDMTYVEDVVESIVRLLRSTLELKNPEIFNIGNRSPVKISDVLMFLADQFDISPRVHFVPKGPDEPSKTWSGTDKLESYIDYAPKTNYSDGLKKFVEWYRGYNK